MTFDFKGRSLLTLKDYSKEEIDFLLKNSKKEKESSKSARLSKDFRKELSNVV